MSKKNKPEETGAVEPDDSVTQAAKQDGPETEGENEAVDPLQQAQQQATENHDMYLRARADLENFRRRAQKDKEELAKFANENLLRELLPVLDNLSRALDHARGEGEGGALVEGVEMTLGQFNKALEQFGVSPVECLEKPFDPNCHEAMGQVESDEHPPNTVVQEMQKGYYLNQRLLRPSLVMVTKAPTQSETTETE